ncbi:MAG: peptide transporter [Flavobacteriales bacterium]|nr:peptide transporter [Flavobacteriales bacterium]
MDSTKSSYRISFFHMFSNKINLLAFVFIVGFFFISIFAYQVMPDATPLANSIELSISKEKPGFTADFLLFKKDNHVEKNMISSFFFGSENPYSEEIVSDHSVIGDTIYYYSYNSSKSFLKKKHVSSLYYMKSGEYFKNKCFFLGTDKYGRDLLSRIILGTRVSFSVGFISVFISVFIGLILGMISGYFGGRIDVIICWLINVVWSIPTLLLVIAISFVLGKGFWQVFIAVGLTMWVEVARVTRGEVLRLSKLPYIEAVKSFGLSDIKIMFKHILPNALNPIIIISAANFATSVLLESGLSFLGIGVQPPMPSWGMIIRNHYGFIVMDKAYLALFPGLCIIVLVLCFMLLANGLRDSFDTKLKNH